jgi:phosphoribosylanthranilate isomerase
MTAIKICGLSRPEDIDAVNAALPDYVGWIFVPASRRHVTAATAAGLRARLDPRITPVGVFRDAPLDTIAHLAETGVVGAAQLHGQEDPPYIAALRARIAIPVIKAIAVTGLDALAARDNPADYLLFDNGAGGTGQSFDLSLIAAARQAGTLTAKPFFIAGGVGAANLQAVLDLHPYGVDLNSGVETDGVKDPAKIAELVTIVRQS